MSGNVLSQPLPPEAHSNLVGFEIPVVVRTGGGAPFGVGLSKGTGVDLVFCFCSPIPTIAIQPSFSTIHYKTLNNFSKVCYSPPVFAKLQHRLRLPTALPRSTVLSGRLIQAISFQTITHYFARRPTPISFSFNHFRTLFTATEGVPSLPSHSAQSWRNLSPLAATLMNLPASVAKKKTYGKSKPFRCNTYKKHGMGVKWLTIGGLHRDPGTNDGCNVQTRSRSAKMGLHGGGDTVSTEAVAARRHAGTHLPVTWWKLEMPTTTWHLQLN